MRPLWPHFELCLHRAKLVLHVMVRVLENGADPCRCNTIDLLMPMVLFTESSFLAGGRIPCGSCLGTLLGLQELQPGSLVISSLLQHLWGHMKHLQPAPFTVS